MESWIASYWYAKLLAPEIGPPLNTRPNLIAPQHRYSFFDWYVSSNFNFNRPRLGPGRPLRPRTAVRPRTAARRGPSLGHLKLEFDNKINSRLWNRRSDSDIPKTVDLESWWKVVSVSHGISVEAQLLAEKSTCCILVLAEKGTCCVSLVLAEKST